MSAAVPFWVKLNTRELGLHRAERVASRATDRPNLSRVMPA
jgi:hypothetical protein